MASIPFLSLIALPVIHAYPITLEPRELICTTATWGSVISFLFLNYVAHVLTIKTFPGDKTMARLGWTAAALLVPYSGVTRAADAISHGRFPYFSKKTDLEYAVRVGALCAVARTAGWVPEANENISGCHLKGISSKPEGEVVSGPWTVVPLEDVRDVSVEDFRIHGQIVPKLPPGYELQILPENIELSAHGQPIELANTHGALKYVASLIQLAYAVVTLYRVRGDQLDKYGYAAYGLTVIPYLVMSLVNLLANICTPDYPLIYMVHSEVMEEVKNRGVWFDGTVGEIRPATEQGETIHIEDASASRVRFKYPRTPIDPEEKIAGDSTVVVDTNIATDRAGVAGEKLGAVDSIMPVDSNVKVEVNSLGRYTTKTLKPRTWWTGSAVVVAIVALAAPYIIIGALTRFDPKQSTRAQRGWTMSWLVLGQVFGASMSLFHFGRSTYIEAVWSFALPSMVLFCGAPPIGGVVVVIEMILSLPICSLIG
jgi:hypothetical protein